MFNAMVVEKDEDGKTFAALQQINEDQLPEGDVTVAVDYSTVNYKDGLCLGSGGGLVRNYPHVPGIDFAGTVESSDDPRYKAGDKVVLTGWRVGENMLGRILTKSAGESRLSRATSKRSDDAASHGRRNGGIHLYAGDYGVRRSRFGHWKRSSSRHRSVWRRWLGCNGDSCQYRS